ncbi:MAG: HAD-IA family hydrolase [Blastochloris sp.]|nr:HAD-IA family hydrolase [Blastochloris sp.]
MNQVIFFDVGGTLIRLAQPVGYYYAEMAWHYGLRADALILQEGFKRAWKSLEPRDPVAGNRIKDDKGWWRSLVLEAWSQHPRPEAFPFNDYFEELYGYFARPGIWKIFPEVEGCLSELRQRGYRLGVLSNWDRRLRSILSGLELMDYFEDCVISSEVGVEKPHLGIFQIAMERFKIEASQAILVGDEPRFDEEGARSAGWGIRLVDRPGRDLRDVLADCLRK